MYLHTHVINTKFETFSEEIRERAPDVSYFYSVSYISYSYIIYTRLFRKKGSVENHSVI